MGLGSYGFERTVSGFWAGSSPATVRRERSASDGIAVFRRRRWANGSKLFPEALPSKENVIVPMPDCVTFEAIVWALLAALAVTAPFAAAPSCGRALLGRPP